MDFLIIDRSISMVSSLCIKMFKSLRAADRLYVERLEIILVRAMADPWPKWWSKGFLKTPVPPVSTKFSLN
jgi:hypothetical protein